MSIQSTGLSGEERNLSSARDVPEPIDPSDLADENEAAETLGVVPGTLATWRSKGLGPVYVKVGRTIRYPRAAIRNHLAAGLITPSPAEVRRLARVNQSESTASPKRRAS
jgi:hypothetical protein